MQKYDEIKVGLTIPDLHDYIQIALANIPIDQMQVEASYLRTPVRTFTSASLNPGGVGLKSFESF